MSEYWTVGEFARRAGVTVRTVQFYDQQKLLAPSAKGPQNRRLYSEEDERELQRILVLKFLGNSLSDIRKVLAHKLDGVELSELIDRQVELLGRDLVRLMHRMSALRALRAQVSDGESPDWAGIAGLIDEAGSNPSTLRHSMHEQDSRQPADGRDELAQWQDVIVTALGLMAAGVSPDDPWAHEIALRYVRLCDRLGQHRPSEFIPLDDGPRPRVARRAAPLRRRVSRLGGGRGPLPSGGPRGRAGRADRLTLAAALGGNAATPRSQRAAWPRRLACRGQAARSSRPTPAVGARGGGGVAGHAAGYIPGKPVWRSAS